MSESDDKVCRRVNEHLKIMILRDMRSNKGHPGFAKTLTSMAI